MAVRVSAYISNISTLAPENCEARRDANPGWGGRLDHEEDCYLCEGYERIRANARDRKAARR